ncbi:MAG: Do family serine endopeptidase [Alkalispirochaeta sp.]
MHTQRLRKILRLSGIGILVLAVSAMGGVIGARLTDSSPSEVQMNRAPTVEATPASYSPDSGDDVSHAFQDRFRTVAADTVPVVAEINTVNTVTQRVPGNPFSFFFGRPEQEGQEREFQQEGLGSGVLVAREGDTVYVLTNHHVAGEADEIEIVLSDGRSFTGELVGSDERLDLALLSFETTDEVPLARLGTSSSLELGDWVFAVGNPLGFSSSVTAGIVSATERTVPVEAGLSGVTDYIQTDASINQGNSGGALVNLDGEVVGINTWIASRSGGSDGIGFAIPIDMAQRAVTDFIERGEVRYSWLGVLTGNPSEPILADLDAEGEKGAFVYGVYDGSPADEGDLRPGDIVTAINGETVESGNDLVRRIATLDPGAEAEVTVVRNGQEEVVQVATSTRDPDVENNANRLWPGLAVAPLTDEIRSQLDLSRRASGVLVAAVTEDSPADGSGLRRGDVITAVNESGIDTLSEFYQAIAEADGREVEFRVNRNGNNVILGFERP